MVEFNNRTDGTHIELGANIPQHDMHHHEDILAHIAHQYRVVASMGKNAPVTALDNLDTARDAAFSSMKSHQEGNAIAAQANMQSAAGHVRIAAEALGIPSGATPEVEQSMGIANQASDTNDDYQRKTGGTQFTIGRFS